MTEPAVLPKNHMAHKLPDVCADDGPLTRAILGLIEDLGAARLDADGYLDAALALYRRMSPWEAFGRVIQAAHAERQDQIILRKDLGGRDYTLMIIYVKPGEVHPCHHHHNAFSIQGLLEGGLHVREYDRISREDERHILLRPVIDGRYAAGDAMRTTEFYRNAHWFGALEEPALMLNLNCRGYETVTFDPDDGRSPGRRLLDPTLGAVGPDTLRAAELRGREIYPRFGSTPLAAFPLPVPAPARQASFRLRD